MNYLLQNNIKLLKLWIIRLIMYIVVPLVLWQGGTRYYEYSHKKFVVEQETTCPSLLSVARSARDTLIVMKNKTMCAEWMLTNLK
jgi:hypothetical protein